ncbi:c-type cytochrome [Cerasicoccus arenae]|uniref:Cytochrome c domain-containing protein n=1 Tax=Cerasicoccus arenae TaxID=424488 RepID=A0A8J3GET5_9BACT|nr:cytochrome c [Cerasicoccus arenae]MBK1858546.1 cytochrome c [Cerasicoccus arenae]GHC06209.1 hypothetical protein GCM10007047_24120 [Cerasicoccus arenae]
MSDSPTNRQQLPGDDAPYDDDDIHIIHSQLMREKDEPSEGFSPVPIVLLFLFGGLVFWGGVYIANFGGKFRWDVYDPNWEPGMTAGPAVKDKWKTGERLFMNNCKACHQENGAGVPGSYPPLAGSSWVVGDDHRIVKILLNGLSGPIDVEGSSYDGAMPSYGPSGAGWDDFKIAAVATWVRGNFDNGAPEVAEETVAEVRAETAGKSGAWSGAELLDAHPF